MKTALKYIAYPSLILNVFYFAYWIYVSNIYNTHAESVEKYSSLIPFEIQVLVFSLILSVLTIFSIIIFTKQRYNIYKVLIAVQGFFLLTHIWGAL